MKFSLECASTVNLFGKYPQIKEHFKTEEESWLEDKRIVHNDKPVTIDFHYYYIYIKSVNDLLKLKEITKQDLVICDDSFHPNMFQIIIYDDYLE